MLPALWHWLNPSSVRHESFCATHKNVFEAFEGRNPSVKPPSGSGPKAVRRLLRKSLARLAMAVACPATRRDMDLVRDFTKPPTGRGSWRRLCVEQRTATVRCHSTITSVEDEMALVRLLVNMQPLWIGEVVHTTSPRHWPRSVI